jgi:hypothetical protein
MGRDQQIWLKLAQQLDHMKTACQQSAGLGHILKLDHTPIDLVHPGSMALDPVVKSNSGSRKNTRVLEDMFNQNLPIWIPTFQPGLNRIGRSIVSCTTTRGEN